MSSSTIRALEIACEPSYCNLNDGIPSTTGLTFYSVEFIDASQVAPVSETYQDVEDGGRAGLYSMPPEILQTSTGKIIKKGEISLDFYLRARGENGLLQEGLRLLLGTRMLMSEDDAGSSGTVSAVSTNTVTIGEENFGSVGQIIAFQKSPDAPTFYAHVIDVSNDTDSTTLTVIPPLADVVAQGDNAKILASFYMPTFGGDPVRGGAPYSPLNTGSFPTVCLRLSGDGWRQVCWGCQLTSLSITGTDGDSRAVKLTATVNIAYAEDVSPAIPPVGVKYGTQVEHSLAAPLMISSAYSAGTAPTSSITASSQPCVDQWTFTATWTCESSACGNLWLGKAPLEAVNAEYSLELYLGGTSAQSSLLNQFRNANYCGISLGFNADLSGYTGGALVIPAAYLNDGTVSTVDLGSGFVRTHAIFAIGPNTLDAEDTGTACIQLALA